jgi:hypothetical protein
MDEVGSNMGRTWGDLGSCGVVLEVMRCEFLMGYKNFEVPGAVDSEMSRKFAKVIKS